MTTPRGKVAKTSRAAAERNTPEAQFQRMYQENRDLIYHYILSRVGNHEDAEDLTSDIFLKAVGRVDLRTPRSDDPSVAGSGGQEHARRSLA